MMTIIDKARFLSMPKKMGTLNFDDNKKIVKQSLTIVS